MFNKKTHLMVTVVFLLVLIPISSFELVLKLSFNVPLRFNKVNARFCYLIYSVYGALFPNQREK